MVKETLAKDASDYQEAQREQESLPSTSSSSNPPPSKKRNLGTMFK